MNGLYVLEAQHHITGVSCTHAGYMNKLFVSKESACTYYDKHNPHMRSLNAHNNWCSAFDPITNLRFIVRKHYGETKTFPIFERHNKDESDCVIE